MSSVDHYELSNAIEDAKRHADEKARDVEFYVDDKVRDLQGEINHLERKVQGLLDRITTLEYNQDNPV